MNKTVASLCKSLSEIMCHGVVLMAVGIGYAQAAPVGEVIFTIGEARLEGGDKTLAKGMKVEPGQTLVTGANGHIHVRFIDDAFVSVRPGSKLRVEEYVWDAAAPAKNRVKFVLETGTSRLITGKAGSANKEGFRLNTPLAAIGVRGTDFVVAATSDNTRVTVQQGAIVLSPFGEGCAADALGPCGGSLARQLSGSLGGAYLELSGTSRAPTLVTPAEGTKNPNRLVPARPEEPLAGNGHAADAVAAAASSATTPSHIWWGRWGETAQAELTSGSGREVIARSDMFILMRSTDNLDMPGKGVVQFNLAEAEAYKRTPSGTYVPATVDNASLTVDFGKHKFSTSLAFHQDKTEERIQAQGSITSTGRFKTDPTHSNALVSGALSNNGTEAGYFFQKSLENQYKALGVVRWQR